MKEISLPSTGALDERYVNESDLTIRDPVIEVYDPTGGLPADPTIGDRYISDATAEGWTEDYVYEWDGDEWVEEEPEEGWMIWLLFDLLFYVFFSGGWMEVGDGTYVRLTGDTMTGDLTTSGIFKVNSDRPVDRTNDVITSTTTVSNTTDESTLWTGSISADEMEAGNVFKTVASGLISNDSASDDITIAVYMGTTQVESFNPAIGNVTDADWHTDFNITVRSIGATGSVAFHGHTEIDGNDETINSIETIDTTIVEDLTIKVTWDNAKAANAISIYQGMLEIKN